MYHIELEAKLVWHDGSILVSAGGLTIDLGKAQTVDEIRAGLSGLVLSTLNPEMVKPMPGAEPSKPAPAQDPSLGEKFQAQYDALQRRTDEIMQRLDQQREQIAQSYASTLERLKPITQPE